MILEDELLGWNVSSMLLEKSGEQLLKVPVRMKQLVQSRTNAQLWMCLMVKVKSDAVKNNTAQEYGKLGP